MTGCRCRMRLPATGQSSASSMALKRPCPARGFQIVAARAEMQGDLLIPNGHG